MKSKSLKEVLAETDPKIKVIIEKILEVEKEYSYVKNITTEHYKRIQNKIIKIIKEEVK